MIRNLITIFLLTPAAIAQIKPDVSFTGDNDRFDLSEMVRAHNKMFRDIPQIDNDEGEGAGSDADNRRSLHNEDTDKFASNIHPPRVVLTRREDIDFAYDPDNLPTIGRAGDDPMLDLEYQENMKIFKMNIPQSSRRKAITDEQRHEDEVLMQNVVPIVMEVDGYLKAPLQQIVSLLAQQGKKVILKTD